jgi:hypothetical protein
VIFSRCGLFKAKQSVSYFFHGNSFGWFTGIPAVVLAIAFVLIIWWRLGMMEAIFMAITGVLSPIANLFKLVIEQPRPPDHSG